MQEAVPFRIAGENYNPHYRNAEYGTWLVPGIIPRAGLVILASAPKVGKTVFANALATALATGKPFLGLETPHIPVLWCAHEETFMEREKMHENLTKEDPFYIAYNPHLPYLDDDHEVTWDERGNTIFPKRYVFEEALDRGAELIVIDCLHAAVKQTNLADNQHARRVLSWLRRQSVIEGIAVLLLHHVTKSQTRGYHPERFADSTQILASSSTHLFLERIGQEESPRRYLIHAHGRHPAPIPKFYLESDDIHTWRMADQDNYKKSKKPTVADRIAEFLANGPATIPEVAEALNLTPMTVQVTFTQLKKQGILNRFIDNKQRYFALADEQEECS
jgi:RecA-family ATPase